MFSDDEKRAINKAFEDACEHGSIDSAAVAGASKAVELVVSRGGTMTAEQVAEVQKACAYPGPGMELIRVLMAHIATQGARVAVLEADLRAAITARDEWMEKWVGATQNEAKALEHTSDLEKSLENARKERDAARAAGEMERANKSETIATLTRERDDFARQVEGMHEALNQRTKDMKDAEDERDAALADNAALLDALRKARAVVGATATTGFAVGAGVGIEMVIAQPHPGAAMLERLKRLEEALRNLRCIAVSQGVSERHGVVIAADALLGASGEFMAPLVLTQPVRTFVLTGISEVTCSDGSCTKCRSGEPCH